MRSVWLVFRFEYLRHVLTRRFFLALLSPFFIVLLMIVVITVLIAVEYNPRPIGYVDQSGLLATAQTAPRQVDSLHPALRQIRYLSEEAAQTDLAAKKIQAYFVVQPDYLETGAVKQVSLQATGEFVAAQFRGFLRYNLIKDLPVGVQERLLIAPFVTVRSSGGERQASLQQVFKYMLPLGGGLLLLMAVNTSGGYLVQSLVDEKENRTMEILATSISPGSLMAGKIIGNMLVGLTELGAWLIFAIGGMILVRILMPGVDLGLEWSVVWVMALTVLPGFVMVAGLMAAIGVGGADRREASQIAGLVTLPMMAPFMLMVPLMTRPNSPLAVGLSLFPLTAPLTLPLRVAVTFVPLWQVILSITLLSVVAVGSFWIAARVFRLGMLRYGKRLTWREIFALKARGT